MGRPSPFDSKSLVCTHTCTYLCVRAHIHMRRHICWLHKLHLTMTSGSEAYHDYFQWIVRSDAFDKATDTYNSMCVRHVQQPTAIPRLVPTQAHMHMHMHTHALMHSLACDCGMHLRTKVSTHTLCAGTSSARRSAALYNKRAEAAQTTRKSTARLSRRAAH